MQEMDVKPKPHLGKASHAVRNGALHLIGGSASFFRHAGSALKQRYSAYRLHIRPDQEKLALPGGMSFICSSAHEQLSPPPPPPPPPAPGSLSIFGNN